MACVGGGVDFLQGAGVAIFSAALALARCDVGSFLAVPQKRQFELESQFVPWQGRARQLPFGAKQVQHPCLFVLDA